MSASSFFSFPSKRAFGLSIDQQKALSSVLDYFRDNLASAVMSSPTITTPTITDPTVTDGEFTDPALINVTVTGTSTITDADIVNGTMDGTALADVAISGTSTIADATITDGTSTALPVVTLATADGALTLAHGVVAVTKAGVCAMTLAAPSAPQNGLTMTVVSNTANAHTLTATNLIQDGVTGSPQDLATFEAFAGASITLMAYNLTWHVIAKNAVTVSGS